MFKKILVILRQRFFGAAFAQRVTTVGKTICLSVVMDNNSVNFTTTMDTIISFNITDTC